MRTPIADTILAQGGTYTYYGLVYKDKELGDSGWNPVIRVKLTYKDRVKWLDVPESEVENMEQEILKAWEGLTGG